MKLLVSLIILSFCLTAWAAEPGLKAPADQILYVHLKKVGGHITLDSMQVVPGKLKVPKQLGLREGDLRVSVRSSTGTLLSEAATPDPGIVRLEYADEQGQLKTITQVRDSVHFTVRVPYGPEVHSLDFARIARSPGADASAKLREESLGTVIVGSTEGRHE